MSTKHEPTEDMVFLKRDVLSSLETEKFVYEQNSSRYLNNISKNHKANRNSMSLGKVKDLATLKVTKLRDSFDTIKVDNLKDSTTSRNLLGGKLKASNTSISHRRSTKKGDSLNINSLGVPTSRLDADNLNNWLESNLSSIQNDKTKSRVEKIQATQVVYNLVSNK